MPNMSYCRHENTASDLQDVIDNWVTSDGLNGEGERVNLSSYELEGRQRIINQVAELYQILQEDGNISADGEPLAVELPVWDDDELDDSEY